MKAEMTQDEEDSPKDVLSCVLDVEEAVFGLLLLVHPLHEIRGGRHIFSAEDEERLLWCELDTLADDVDELPHSKVGGD